MYKKKQKHQKKAFGHLIIPKPKQKKKILQKVKPQKKVRKKIKIPTV